MALQGIPGRQSGATACRQRAARLCLVASWSIALLAAETALAAPRSAADANVTPPAGSSPIYTRPAVDHVVTYAWWRGFGPKGGDRLTLSRRGKMVREDQEPIGSRRPFDAARSTSYFNLVTAASFNGDLPKVGERGGVSLVHGNRSEDRYRLISTGETRNVAGEDCTIWRAEPERDGGVKHLGCLTRDGVVVYHATLYGDGVIGEERTALKVERRKLRDEEILPPKAAMHWAAWLARTQAAGPPPSASPNHEVRLKLNGGSGGGPDELRYRASSGWSSTEAYSSGKLDIYRLANAAGTLNLAKEAGRITIFGGPGAELGSLGLRVQALDRAPERVLGEECRWFDTTVGFADTSRIECRAKDGLPLVIVERARGGERRYAAASLSRGKTAPEDVTPPAQLLDWTSWGWPDLATPEGGQ